MADEEDDDEYLQGWTEERLEARLVISGTAAEAAAYENVQRLLIEKAGNLFTQGRDDLAKFLRDDLAPEFEKRGKDERKKQSRFQDDYNRRYED